ncbi:MAG: DUF1289 domain-containing protein [Halioglobus sp.]
MTENEPKSPCVSICVLDDQDVCQGCFRTGTEITDWFMASGDEKRQIIENAKVRLRDSNLIFLK